MRFFTGLKGSTIHGLAFGRLQRHDSRRILAEERLGFAATSSQTLWGHHCP
jgi:hypothetical protein